MVPYNWPLATRDEHARLPRFVEGEQFGLFEAYTWRCEDVASRVGFGKTKLLALYKARSKSEMVWLIGDQGWRGSSA
jgi:hypothetical protein